VDNPVETEVNFELGESVKITDGPFSGFNGTVDEILEDKRKRHIDSFIREHRDELKITSGANNIIYKNKK
jgi:transcription antitermination factor NusG